MTLVFDAPSISMTSGEMPFEISMQCEHFPQGVADGPFPQFSAFARMRAVDVFPRGCGKKIRVRDFLGFNRIFQGFRNEFLPGKRVKRLRTAAGRCHFVSHAPILAENPIQ